MCPVCLATAALVVAVTASTGGLTSLLAFKLTSAERSNTPPGIGDVVKKIGGERHE
jgi:hypothetical protein